MREPKFEVSDLPDPIFSSPYRIVTPVLKLL